MYKRDIADKLKQISKELPVIAILGPRQSGKTTVSKMVFPNHTYVSLEDLDKRLFATKDPRGFLEYYKNSNGIILDEIQNVPDLLSYIQTYVDQEKLFGYFILTGSQNFLVSQTISQTLAGRIAVFTLLPFSIPELKNNNILPETIEELVYKGSYPRLYNQNITLSNWFSSYTLTYIERDVRQVANVPDLTTFQLFLKLCAGRIGQILNVSSLSNSGIPMRTIEAWLSILQSSYIIFLLQPHYKNFNKRLIKTPKLYFYDTGLACSLLEIESVEQLKTHYLRGGLVECNIISDFIKQFYNKARIPHVYFWRDNQQREIDCLIEKSDNLYPIEIKAGKTIGSDYFNTLQYWQTLTDSKSDKNYIIYAGNEGQKRNNIQVISWNQIDKITDDIL